MSRTRRGKNAASIAGDFMLAPMVAAMRMPLMAAESQSHWRPESTKAVTEKLAAVGEGIAAAQLSYFSSMMSFWPEVMSGKTPALFSGVATERSVNAALKPASRTVKANFRRLSNKV